MSDFYSKCVLTLIAGALTWIAAQSLVTPAVSQPPSCGVIEDRPCFVAFSCNSAISTAYTPRWVRCDRRNTD